MAQFKFNTLPEAVVKVKEIIGSVESVSIIKSLEGGLRKGPVVFYVEDQEESGFTRFWESNLFMYEKPGYITTPRVKTRKFNDAMRQLEKLQNNVEI